jgi:hypothetical protein
MSLHPQAQPDLRIQSAQPTRKVEEKRCQQFASS